MRFQLALNKTVCPILPPFIQRRFKHRQRPKINKPDISILTAYEITLTTILKHVFHEATHEEVYIRIIILKVNA